MRACVLAVSLLFLNSDGTDIVCCNSGLSVECRCSYSEDEIELKVAEIRKQLAEAGDDGKGAAAGKRSVHATPYRAQPNSDSCPRQ